MTKRLKNQTLFGQYPLFVTSEVNSISGTARTSIGSSPMPVELHMIIGLAKCHQSNDHIRIRGHETACSFRYRITANGRLAIVNSQ